jgi:hypothetical protein
MMAHRIEIRLRAFSDDEHHKVRNFIEDVWLEVCRRGWAEPQDFDHRVVPGAHFHFAFPARRSHEAVTLVERLIASNFMVRLATFTHEKRAEPDA